MALEEAGKADIRRRGQPWVPTSCRILSMNSERLTPYVAWGKRRGKGQPPTQSPRTRFWRVAGFRGGRVVDLFERPITIAAAFEDGSATGDAALLSRLVSRRGSMLQEVELACEILSDAGSHSVPRGQLVQQFRTMADSLNHCYLPPEQQVGRTLYKSIVEKLMNLPPQQAGSPFPPTTFVEQEIIALNHQRIALLESQPGLGVVATTPRR